MTSLPRLVGLIGRKGSGKDTAALALLPKGYANVKFAGALKDMLRCLLLTQGVDAKTVERMIEGDLKEEPTSLLGGRTPRYAMQTLGTEWGREIMDDALWVDIAIRKALQGPTVITDVRFPNEMAAIKRAGGVCIGIKANWLSAQAGEHESEALVDDLINSLPASQQLLNQRGEGEHTPFVIQEFQTRFLTKLAYL